MCKLHFFNCIVIFYSAKYDILIILDGKSKEMSFLCIQARVNIMGHDGEDSWSHKGTT